MVGISSPPKQNCHPQCRLRLHFYLAHRSCLEGGKDFISIAAIFLLHFHCVIINNSYLRYLYLCKALLQILYAKAFVIALEEGFMKLHKASHYSEKNKKYHLHIEIAYYVAKLKRPAIGVVGIFTIAIILIAQTIASGMISGQKGQGEV